MSMAESSVFAIQAFGACIRVECNSAELGQALSRYLLPPFPRSCLSSTSADIDISVTQRLNSFDIAIGSDIISSAGTLGEATLQAVKALDDALVSRLKNLHAIHAGAVVIEGRALLVPGSTHAGKSSLIAELLRRGAEHLSDEYALIDRNGCVHAYPRPLLLRNGAPKQSLVLPQDLNATFAADSAPVAWVFAVGYREQNEWSIAPLSQSETVMLLLRNTPHEMAHSPEMIDSFIRVAANAACFSGTRGEATEAANHILEFIRSK